MGVPYRPSLPTPEGNALGKMREELAKALN
jgi:hypothetical protein